MSSLQSRLGEIHALLGQIVSADSAHTMMDLALATVASVKLSIDEDGALVWLLFVGPPSSGKTEVLLALRQSLRTEFLDKPTPEMFSSGAYDAQTGQKAKPYLPKLDGRALVMKDLTTLFSMKQEKVKTILGDMQSIYDGEFTKGTGMAFGAEEVATTHVSRFSYLGGVTPEAVAKHHRYMSQIGTRFLIYRVPSLTPTEISKGFTLADDPQQKGLRVKLRALVREHIEEVLSALAPVTVSDADTAWLRAFSQLVAAGRTPVVWTPVGVGLPQYEPVVSQPEAPYRAYKQLRTLLRASAWLRGDDPSGADRALVRQVALSSILGDRAQVLEVMTAQGSGVTVQQCAVAINRSETATRTRLEEMVKVGLLVEQSGAVKGNVGQPPVLYAPTPAFAPIILEGNKP